MTTLPRLETILDLRKFLKNPKQKSAIYYEGPGFAVADKIETEDFYLARDGLYIQSAAYKLIMAVRKMAGIDSTDPHEKHPSLTLFQRVRDRDGLRWYEYIVRKV